MTAFPCQYRARNQCDCSTTCHHFDPPDLILIGCTKTKRPVRSKARDLYDPSDLFRRRRAHAVASGLPWAILSARHGVVDPDRELDPYTFTIEQRNTKDHSPFHWAIGALQDCFLMLGREAVFTGHHREFVDPLTIEVHAGIEYIRILETGFRAFAGTTITIEHPVRGLGIGQQKAWYGGQQGVLL